MNGVMQWAAVICLSALVCGMLELLVPDGNMEKMVRLVLGAVLLLAVLSPLTGTLGKLDLHAIGQNIETTDTASLTETVNQQIVQTAQENVQAVAQEILEENETFPQKIQVMMDTSQDDSISITKLIVTLDKEDNNRKDEARRLLEEKMELPVEVTAD